MAIAYPSLEEVNQELERRQVRESLLSFVYATHLNYKANWFHEVVCRELEQFIDDIHNGKQPRLMINCPPRHGKSAIVSERFPVWALGHHPDWQILAASYAAAMAEKFSRKARSIVDEPITQDAFPLLQLNPKRQGVEEWETTEGGVYKALGVGGPATGSGAHILLIDDPVKGHEQAYSEVYREKVYEWYRSDAETRLMPESGVIIVQTRWHQDDLSGRLLTDESERWRRISFPAIAEEVEEHRQIGEALHPERYPLERLQKIQEKSSWVWSALYQQRPSPEEGGMFKRHHWQFYDTLPESFEKIIQSWDMAFKETKKSDFVVGQVWGKIGADVYLIDQVRARMDFVATQKALKNLSTKYPKAYRKLIEEKANGAAIISSLKHDVGGLIPINPDPKGSKETRAHAVTPFVEAGNVYLPNPARATWVNEFIEELAAFPTGVNDDQVDAMTQALDDLLCRKFDIYVGLA